MSNLCQELEDMYGEKASVSKGDGKRLFLEQQHQIVEAISAGWKYNEIYTCLKSKGKMPISYRVFCIYVNNFITPKDKEEALGSDSFETNDADEQAECNVIDITITIKLPPKFRLFKLIDKLKTGDAL